MIRGVVNARREVVVRLRVRGPSGIEVDVDFVVDTGFTSALTLPITTIRTLGLARQSFGTGRLADGTLRQFEIYSAEVEWGGTWKPGLVSAIGSKPLLGMSMLETHKLSVDVVPGGLVEILPLP